ncbi:hypothetical protein TNCV_2350721 [Trichonephila clavipes]|uniref:Uncharacterized protein n=1 Tax=Trichonephila clavipes TaxID=2585209 RepID=A0A8X6VKP2_TRICX|nr:hypothetical protein TNCV_2350721 [Trichonephila clavipes]
MVKVSDHDRHVMSSRSVPLKTRRVGQVPRAANNARLICRELKRLPVGMVSIANSPISLPTLFSEPVCFSDREKGRKATSGKKKLCVNKRNKLSDSNPDLMNSGTFVRNDGTGLESITSRSCTHGRISECHVFKEKVAQPVMQREVLKMAIN